MMNSSIMKWLYSPRTVVKCTVLPHKTAVLTSVCGAHQGKGYIGLFASITPFVAGESLHLRPNSRSNSRSNSSSAEPGGWHCVP